MDIRQGRTFIRQTIDDGPCDRRIVGESAKIQKINLSSTSLEPFEQRVDAVLRSLSDERIAARIEVVEGICPKTET